RRALDDVGRGRADDAARRHGDDLRARRRCIRDHRPRKLPGRLRTVGDRDHGRHFRRLRAGLSPRHRGRARRLVGEPEVLKRRSPAMRDEAELTMHWKLAAALTVILGGLPGAPDGATTTDYIATGACRDGVANGAYELR